jgi:acyl carrier protein
MDTDMIGIDSVKSKVEEHILSSSFNEKNKIEEDTMIFKEGILDSMGLMTLITFLEEEFGIATQDTDLVEENFETIAAITNFVTQKLS